MLIFIKTAHFRSLLSQSQNKKSDSAEVCSCNSVHRFTGASWDLLAHFWDVCHRTNFKNITNAPHCIKMMFALIGRMQVT